MARQEVESSTLLLHLRGDEAMSGAVVEGSRTEEQEATGS
jgi:hypothetical protein